MIEHHPLFMQPENVQAKIWRYMDLSKFLSLLQSRCLYFARADRLGDPFEGSVPKKNADAGAFIVEMRKSDERFKELYKDMSDEQVINLYKMLSHSRKSVVEKVFILCWHVNDHESAAMWKIYSKSDESICIQARYDIVAEALPRWCNMGLVSYIDYETDMINEGNIFAPFLTKRRSFQHEMEARAVIWTEISDEIGGKELKSSIKYGGVSLPIDLNKVVQKVFVNTTSPDWYLDSVQKLSRVYGLEAEVVRSSLANSPMY